MAHKVQDWDDFQDKLKENGDKLVIVCLSASECDKCADIQTTLEQLSADFGNNCSFLEIDADMTDVADTLGVNKYPTFHFYQGGKQIDGEVRGADSDSIKELMGLINDKLN